MTALTTIFGLVPLALGLSEGALLSASLATVVIGGLMSSTALTLVVIPVVYTLVDGLRTRGNRREAGHEPDQEPTPTGLGARFGAGVGAKSGGRRQRLAS